MIPESPEMILFAVDCSACDRPTVTSEICQRPDLCYACFGDWLFTQRLVS